jgi:hypothetical protein
VQLRGIACLDATVTPEIKDHHSDDDGKVEIQVVHVAQETNWQDMPETQRLYSFTVSLISTVTLLFATITVLSKFVSHAQVVIHSI